MTYILKLCFLFTLILQKDIEGANIFIYMGILTSHSPTASIQPLADKLVQIGHNVTLFSPIEIPDRHPDLNLFCPPQLLKYYQEFIVRLGTRSTQAKLQKGFNSASFSELIFNGFDESHHVCRLILNNPSFIELMREGKFDLFIVDNAGNDCGFPMAFHFKAKIIIYSALTTLPWEGQNFGVPAELSWLPGFGTAHSQIGHTTLSMDGASGKIPFLDRIMNTAMIVGLTWLYRSYHLPRIENIYRTSYLAESLEGMPELEKFIQKTSLVLINQHYSDQFPRPYPPFVVQVGGMHVVGPLNGTLTHDIESFIGDSEFIYISFGTFIRVSSMPNELIQIFFDVFRSTKYKFLWKWEGKLPANPPSNILIQPWFSQLNVLAHPKIRGFITQGGQISVTQSACRGVPMIICPVDGDQPLNAVRMLGNGNAIVLDLATLTGPQLAQALWKLVTDPSIASNAEKISIACKDRPMSPLDTAVWWTEWVLRTNDTSLLKPASIGQSLWLYWNLDIWTFLFFFLISLSLLLIFILKFIFKHLFRRFSSKSKLNKIKIS